MEQKSSHSKSAMEGIRSAKIYIDALLSEYGDSQDFNLRRSLIGIAGDLLNAEQRLAELIEDGV